MKLLITSDLHVDFGKDPLSYFEDNDFDVAIVAGDVANHAKECLRYMTKFEKICGEKPYIYVPGNHCRWSLSFSESEKYLSKCSGYMNRTVRVINDQRFLGCTLWYKPEEEINRRMWSDYRWIDDYENIRNEHELDMKFLIDNLQEGDIVVTHMLPSYQCISYKYIGDDMNKYYYTELIDLIKERKPKLWISGHSHEEMMRFITPECFYFRNPLGYPTERDSRQIAVLDINNLKSYDGLRYFDYK